MKKTKQHTVEVVLNRTTPVHILSRHTRRRAFVMSLISGHFQQVVCDSYHVLTKAVSLHCDAWVAPMSRRLCDKQGKCQLIQLMKRTIHYMSVTKWVAPRTLRSPWFNSCAAIAIIQSFMKRR